VIEIVEPGPFTTIQDGGRIGYASLGVPRSGAFDVASWQLANRLVGNDADAAALEIVLGGVVLRAVDAVTIAMTGAPCAGLDWGTATTLRAGDTVRLARPATGLRTYLAVRGGIDVPTQLGSRSTDTLSGLGPAPVQRGAILPVGRASADVAGAPATASTPAAPVLRARVGPRDDWFTEPDHLFASEWTVRADSDRIGVRLDGPPLRRSRPDELPSEPTLPGAVQVPHDGRPIVLGPDAPVTGGYPVLAVVHRDDLRVAAQLRPGDTVRFTAWR
jgi:biotin-dependent carboxylase-like uncharacterized protein